MAVSDVCFGKINSMKKLIQRTISAAPHWISGLRPFGSIFTGMLAHIGYVLAKHPTNWLVVGLVTAITGVTMLENDYVDRRHDAQKENETFVLRNEKLYRNIVAALWYLLILISLYTSMDIGRQGILLFTGIGAGLIYSHTRKFLAVPGMIVACAGASPLLFPMLGGYGTMTHWYLFSGVAVFLFGREIIKDTEDRYIDRGWKNTLLTAGTLTEDTAPRVVSCFITLGLIMSLPLFGSLHLLSGIIYCLGLLFLAIAIYIFYRDSYIYLTGKTFMDWGMCAVVLAGSLAPLF